MSESHLSLVAHLMRRAGFGLTRDELETYADKGYDEIVDDLLHPERSPAIEEDLMERYFGGENINIMVSQWIYRMVNTQRPLEEKMALFWHHIFATGFAKSQHPPTSAEQVKMFRSLGMTNMKTILMELSKDPAMIYWLDNNENRNGEPNENWGRELMELFSMGAGNYSEDDIKNAARAFTGWTFEQPIPLYPHGHYPAVFEFREDDHDNGEKSFLGHTGNLNGDDIIDIIAGQEATPRFICRHLSNFFVADEPQVPAWPLEPPRYPELVDAMVKTYFDTDGDITAILHTMFTSDAFKQAASQKVKSPAELVIGILRLVGTFRFPQPGLLAYNTATGVMGQELLNPPTVEGWHTGKEWIDGGTLNERINFAADEIGDSSKPGVQAIIERLSSAGSLQPEEFTDQCLTLVGIGEISNQTRDALLVHAKAGGEIGFDGDDTQREETESKILRMLQLIVASKEYQYA